MTARKPRTPKPAQTELQAIPADERNKTVGEALADPTDDRITELPADGVEREVELTGDGSGETLPELSDNTRAALRGQVLGRWRPDGYGTLSLVHRNGHLYLEGPLPEKVAFTPELWAVLTGDGLIHNRFVGVNEDKTEIAVSAVGVSFTYQLEADQPDHWKLAFLVNADVDHDDAEYALNEYGVWFRG